MAEAVVEPRRPGQRFFCHRCNLEFEDVMQDYTCPFCCMGFIEHLDDTQSSAIDDGEYSDADMTNLEDSSHLDGEIDESDDPLPSNTSGQPVLNDLAFLMTGGRLRPGSGIRRSEGSRSLLEQLVLMIGGGRGAVTAGAPFVLVGAPGDYVFGGEGLDAVVTQLLGQLENTGPPPLPSEQIQSLPSDTITADQVEANMSCSVCWDNFTLGESVSRLACEHIFHPGCISPWLQLHATCPICRRSLLPEPAPGAASTATASTTGSSTPASSSSGTTHTEINSMPGGFSRVVVRRVGGRRRRGGAGGAEAPARGLWAALTSHLAASGSSADSGSRSSLGSDATYMDIDFD